MAPWEVMSTLKDLSARLSAVEWPPGLADVQELLAKLVLIVETQQHDLHVLKATVARLEHHVRHRGTLQ